MGQWKQTPCRFAVGDRIVVGKGYLARMMLGPNLAFNDGDEYEVVALDKNPLEREQAFVAVCRKSARRGREGSTELITCHMPVYSYFEKAR